MKGMPMPPKLARSAHGVRRSVTERDRWLQFGPAGEVRVRRARSRDFERIPAIVRQLADQQQLELAWSRTCNDEDLRPM